MSTFATFALSFLVLVLVVAAMAIGVIAGRQPIRGSCGGVGTGGCELCSGTGECRRRKRAR